MLMKKLLNDNQKQPSREFLNLIQLMLAIQLGKEKFSWMSQLTKDLLY